MADHRHARVLIIGGGPAGYTAAIYAARGALAPTLIEGLQRGGQLTLTSDVENFPGFAKAVQGPWLMDQMREQAAHVGADLVADVVTRVELDGAPFRIHTDSGDLYTADSLIVATGAQARWLGLPSERAFFGAGVSACATCDGFFFRGRQVCVVGGGNTAIEEALYLTNHAARVVVIHRRDSFRAEKILQRRLRENPRITVVWDSVVEEIVGDEVPFRSVTGVRIRNLRTGAVQLLPTDGLFVAIGHSPATGLFRGQLDLDEAGYVRVAPWSTGTSRPGVFAAGDVADSRYRQAVTAAAMGCMAALDAEKFLSNPTAHQYNATMSVDVS